VEHKQHICRLEDKLENIALKNSSKTTINHNHNNQRTILINNYIDNMKPITYKMLLDSSKYLTEDHIRAGKDGFVRYFLEYPLKGNILCTDYSRKKVKYKDEDGKLIVDHNMSKLRPKLIDSIKDKALEIDKYIEKKDNLLVDDDLDWDSDDDSDTRIDKSLQMDIRLQTMNLLCSLRSFIGEEIKGIETESIDYIVKNLISKSVL